MNECYEKVKNFLERAKQEVPKNPVVLSNDKIARRIKWLLEEIDELKSAEDIVEQVDAFMDIIYFAIGGFVELGVEPKQIFYIIHESNMSKLDVSKINYDSNGKVMKPSNWKTPYELIRNEIEKQVSKSENY